MIAETSLRAASRLARALLIAAASVAGMSALSAQAQDLPRVTAPLVDPPATDEPEDAAPEAETPAVPDTNGALVFHGNYCGPGSRGAGRPPVDALDEACMHHDACSPPVGQGLPSCACNARLRREAALVARSPNIPDDERVAANFVAEGAAVLACR